MWWSSLQTRPLSFGNKNPPSLKTQRAQVSRIECAAYVPVGRERAACCLPAHNLFEVLVELLDAFPEIFLFVRLAFDNVTGGIGAEVGVGQFS